LDFNIKNLWAIRFGGVEVWITETIVNTWIIMALLVGFAVFVRIRLKKFSDVPKGLQNIVELMIESFDKFVISAAGPKFLGLSNWYFMVFAFVFVSNVSGLFGMRPPTADWVTTFALALVTFLQIQVMGAVHRKGKYLKSFFEPTPVFFPLNLIGELARPISLSFRLFGNVLAGVILMSIIYALFPIFLKFFVPVPLHAFFDIFSGTLQVYIFSILSLTFIGAAASSEV